MCDPLMTIVMKTDFVTTENLTYNTVAMKPHLRNNSNDASD